MATDVVVELQKAVSAEARCWPCVLMGVGLVLYGCALVYANWKVKRG